MSSERPSHSEHPLAFEKFSSFINLGINQALHDIQAVYEENEDPLKNLSHHNSHHTRSVIKRTEQILTVMHAVSPDYVTKRDIMLGRFDAAYHDAVQIIHVSQKSNSTIPERVRIPGDSEEASVLKAFSFMDKINSVSLGTFVENDYQVTREGILATIPSFTGKTVIQPYLEQTSSPVALAVALSDINTAGIEDAQKVLHESQAIFKENNLDLLFKQLTHAVVSKDEAKAIRERVLSWYKFQISFAEGRQQRFPKEIARLPKNVREQVANLFSHFDTTINDLKDIVTEKAQLSPHEIITELYPEISESLV